MNLELQKGSRSRILAAMVLGIMAVFVVRLFYLQIIQHDYYVELASNEQVKRLTIPAKRGLIYALDDKKPVALVMNQTVYTVFADPVIIAEKDKSKIVDTIKQIAGGNAKSDLEDLLNVPGSRYQILATRITRSQADKIKEKHLKGIGFQEQTQRVYPESSLAAQTLGFVDFGGVGRYGVEGKLNDRLSGVDGILQSVTDVSAVPLTIGKNYINQPAVDGDNLVLSIDRNIQSYVEKALDAGLKRSYASKGSIIVMNPQNGQVMAMANFPTYKPAEFNKVKDVAVFNNGVVSLPYEPGSDIKTLTMATGIDKNVVSATATYNNTDSIKIDDKVIANAALGHTGEITFQYAMNWSLNTGFVTIALRLGDGENITRGARDIMYEYFHDRFKLGQLTGVEVAGEEAGTIISPEETEGNAVRYSNMTFGQGMDATMVQVAAAFSSIINGGNYYKPTVLAGVINKDGDYIKNKIEVPSNPIKKTSADQVREMTHVARSNFFGINDKSGYYVGGKTGTSQVFKNGTYDSNETIGTYLGYGGTEELSNYVIMVQVSGDDVAASGSADAMPIFTDISNWMLDYLKLQPKG